MDRVGKEWKTRNRTNKKTNKKRGGYYYET
jgi:hypothetical protein